ncbi:hypothetical protein Y032_0424g1221 [Ancylostoma ceylanicum]|uniref:Uncharacterized protein n=1 Tax=Ancylostoma ceylanicum TaxID=53326 RepID=A0A016X2V3_9BILA|nr:hypothetical protein Y032_0424g1221 [Ancylostoma ceylanicum]
MPVLLLFSLENEYCQRQFESIPQCGDATKPTCRGIAGKMEYLESCFLLRFAPSKLLVLSSKPETEVSPLFQSWILYKLSLILKQRLD